MCPTQAVNLLLGLRAMQQLQENSATAVYWSYIAQRAMRLGLRTRSEEELVLARLACLTRVSADEVQRLWHCWGRLRIATLTARSGPDVGEVDESLLFGHPRRVCRAGRSSDDSRSGLWADSWTTPPSTPIPGPSSVCPSRSQCPGSIGKRPRDVVRKAQLEKWRISKRQKRIPSASWRTAPVASLSQVRRSARPWTPKVCPTPPEAAPKEVVGAPTPI